MDPGQNKERQNQKRKVQKHTMVTPITTCHSETCYLMRRDDKNVPKYITTMKVGGKRPLEMAQTVRNGWTGCEVISRKTRLIQSLHRIEIPGETKSWQPASDRDKIGKGMHIPLHGHYHSIN